jgi:stage II sporulation protein E
MLELSNKCKNKLVFDREKEKKALEELTFLSVLVKEVVVCEEKDEPLITLTVAAKDAEKSVIIPVMNRVTGRTLMLSKEESTSDGFWRILFFAPKPKYNVTLGFCQRAKENGAESGDTDSFLRLGGNKILLALCDGMGSGEKARATSSTAISLVENFYKADFDSEIVLSSVNKLLSANSEESFSALDVCALNLNNGNADFIKLGCPHSVVKTKGGVSFIQGGSLPLGVLEQIKPMTTKKILAAGDIIVMYSDGFSDCFADKNEIAYLLEQNTLTNAQLVAETLLAEAMARCSDKPSDDVTVIAARIING